MPNIVRHMVRTHLSECIIISDAVRSFLSIKGILIPNCQRPDFGEMIICLPQLLFILPDDYESFCQDVESMKTVFSTYSYMIPSTSENIDIMARHKYKCSVCKMFYDSGFPTLQEAVSHWIGCSAKPNG